MGIGRWGITSDLCGQEFGGREKRPMDKKAFGKRVTTSKLFLYKTRLAKKTAYCTTSTSFFVESPKIGPSIDISDLVRLSHISLPRPLQTTVKHNVPQSMLRSIGKHTLTWSPLLRASASKWRQLPCQSLRDSNRFKSLCPQSRWNIQ